MEVYMGNITNTNSNKHKTTPPHFWPGRVVLGQICLQTLNSYLRFSRGWAFKVLPSANPRPMWPDHASGKKIRQKSFSFSSITFSFSSSMTFSSTILPPSAPPSVWSGAFSQLAEQVPRALDVGGSGHPRSDWTRLCTNRRNRKAWPVLASQPLSKGKESLASWRALACSRIVNISLNYSGM